jgi:hypothetical protein
MVERVLTLAATWPAWDGRPRPRADVAFVYTPHKAIRRVTDHLAELEARLAGVATVPDQWHGSVVTTAADLAPFTADDLDEARSRLGRLAQVWALRLGALDAERLDRPEGGAWTLRQVAFHVAESVVYAESVGELTGPHHRACA